MSCTTVSTDLYWNAVATPLFIITLIMGLGTLFSLDTATLGTASEQKGIARAIINARITN